MLKCAKSQPIATALMHACTIILFVSDVPDEVVSEFTDYLTSVLTSPKPAYDFHLWHSIISPCSAYPSIAKAIDCWVMLKSIQAIYMVLNPTLPSFASLVTNCLELADMPIRIASARCLVFIKELMNDVSRNIELLNYLEYSYSYYSYSQVFVITLYKYSY